MQGSPGRWLVGGKREACRHSPVSALDSQAAFKEHGVRDPGQDQQLPSLRQFRHLDTAQSLVELLADPVGRQNLRQRSPLTICVTAGAWTPDRRTAFCSAVAASNEVLLPEEVSEVAASLQAEVDQILLLLRTRRIKVLHFCTPSSTEVASGRRTTEVMHRALLSGCFHQQQVAFLRELAIHDWLATRECCHALPALAGSLQRLLLSGCESRLDLGPLAKLHSLTELILECDAVPDLGSLPETLQRLELDVATVAARVHLPRHLRLEMLCVACSGGAVYMESGVLGQCKEVKLACGMALFTGMVDTGTPASIDAGVGTLMRLGAQTLLQNFYRLPIQQLHIQADRLAFSRHHDCRHLAAPIKHWPHQLRYVHSASFSNILAAALPYWQHVEVVRLRHCPSAVTEIQQEAMQGVQLSKRSSLSGSYSLPPLGQLGTVDMQFLAALAVPTELRFHPSDNHNERQQRLLGDSTFQVHAGPCLRRLHDVLLGQGTDLSMMSRLESLSAVWSGSGGPPTHPLPASTREVELTAENPDAVLDGTALLACFSGDLTARNFAAVVLPLSSRPSKIDLKLSGRRCLNDTNLQLGSQFDCLSLSIAATGGTCTQVELGAWLGQARLVGIDLRPASRDAGIAAGSSSSVETYASTAAVKVVFPGEGLRDLFSGVLRSAAAKGLRRLELVCGGHWQHFDCPSLRLMARSGNLSRCFSLKQLRQLPPTHLYGWQVCIAAEPWRACFVHLGLRCITVL